MVRFHPGSLMVRRCSLAGIPPWYGGGPGSTPGRTSRSSQQSDDRPGVVALPLPQVPRRLHGAVDDAPEVGVEEPAAILGGNVHQAAADGDAGVDAAARHAFRAGSGELPFPTLERSVLTHAL